MIKINSQFRICGN